MSIFTSADERASWKVATKLEKRRLLATVNCLAGLAIFFFGYDQGMMGGVNSSVAYVKEMGLGHVENGKTVVTQTLLQGGIVSVYYLGTLIGCLLGGEVSDRLGRIPSFFVGSLWGVLGAALQCTAQNTSWMIIARLLNGVGTGVLNATVPVYSSELAEYQSRGQFIALEFALNIFGVVIAYWLGFGLSYLDHGDSQLQWRFPIAFQIVMLVVLGTGCWICPESPRWLCMKGRQDEALYVLTRLRGEDCREEWSDIQANVESQEDDEPPSYIAMLFGTGDGENKHHNLPRRVQLVIWLQILQCWSGIAGVTMYAPIIFEIAGFGTQKSLWIAGLNNIFYTAATFICVFTIDRIGRRGTLWWGAAGQAIAMFLAGGLATAGIQPGADQKAWGIAATAMVYLYTFIFGATWLTVPWLYPAEIFPLKVRSKGNAWGVIGWSLGNGSLTLALPYIFSAIGASTMYVFGAVNILSIPIVWAFYPESSQRTLEDIEVLFATKSPWVWSAEAEFATYKTSHSMHTSDAVNTLQRNCLDKHDSESSVEQIERMV